MSDHKLFCSFPKQKFVFRITFRNSSTWYRWISHRHIFISLKCLFNAWTRNWEVWSTKNASTRRTGSTMWLDLPSSRFCLPPSLLNVQQEHFFSISASLRCAPSLEAIKNSQTVGNCQLKKLFSQQQRQGGRRGAGEAAGGGKGGGLQSRVWFVFFFSHRQT